jgi:hypothetical protein
MPRWTCSRRWASRPTCWRCCARPWGHAKVSKLSGPACHCWPPRGATEVSCRAVETAGAGPGLAGDHGIAPAPLGDIPRFGLHSEEQERRPWRARPTGSPWTACPDHHDVQRRVGTALVGTFSLRRIEAYAPKARGDALRSWTQGPARSRAGRVGAQHQQRSKATGA